MHILLLILKIIGIVLLVLLTVLLVVLLLVLFVPVYYKAEGNYKENTPFAKAQVRFLFPLLQVVFSYSGGILEGKLKVLGICAKDFLARDEEKREKNRKPEKNGKNTETTAAKPAEAKDNLKNASKDTPKNASAGNTKDIPKDSTQDSPADSPADNSKEKKTLFDKIKYYIAFLKEKILSIVAKIKAWKNKGLEIRDKVNDFTARIKHYMEIWEMDVTQRAYKKAKKSLFRLFATIKPKKALLRLHFGTDDPAKTGEICAFFGMIYPFVGNYVMIEPDFEQKIFEGDFYIKGHLTVFAVLRAAWVFLFDEDIKKLREILTDSD